jgi:hypothetical protein
LLVVGCWLLVVGYFSVDDWSVDFGLFGHSNITNKRNSRQFAAGNGMSIILKIACWIHQLLQLIQ